MWRRLRNLHVLLHVQAYGDCPVSLAMTHMRRLHGQSGHESTDCTQSVVHCVGGWKTWPIDKCSNKDAGRSQRETPTPCECEQAHARLPSKICFFTKQQKNTPCGNLLSDNFRMTYFRVAGWAMMCFGSFAS